MVEPYVDASEWQSDIEIALYPYARIAHRATYGDGGVDARFPFRWPTFTGKIRQAYDFAYSGDPSVAAQNFLNVVDSVGGFNVGDEVMLDLEWWQDGQGNWQGLPPAQGRMYAKTWLDAMPETTRRFMYGNSGYFEQAGITEADFPNVGLIIASYGSGYRTPAGWSHTCIWQQTSTATVPGFPGEQVDLNQIVCPYNLAHLTIGPDMSLSQADLDQIRQDSADAAVLIVKALQATIGNVTGTIMGNDPSKPDVDPTHFGIGDIGRTQKLMPALIATAVQAAVEQSLSALSPNVDPTMLAAAIAEAVGKAVPGAVTAALAAVKGQITFGGSQ